MFFFSIHELLKNVHFLNYFFIDTEKESRHKYIKHPGPSCSKLTMSLVNDLLKFQT